MLAPLTRQMICLTPNFRPGRGWVELYLLEVEGRVAGHALVVGVRPYPKHVLTEFDVIPGLMKSNLLFRQFLKVS